MKCPNCGRNIIDTINTCPYCRYNFKTTEEVKTVNTINTVNTVSTNSVNVKKEADNNLEVKTGIFSKRNIIIFLAILVLLIVLDVMLFFLASNKNKNNVIDETTTTRSPHLAQESTNIGKYSSETEPLNVGETSVASMFHQESLKIYDVDATLKKFITGSEADELAKSYGYYGKLKNNSRWEAFSYNVKFNDLYSLPKEGISPVLVSSIYNLEGNNTFVLDGVESMITTYDIYDGKLIKNGENADITVLYQVPNDVSDYVVCLGNLIYGKGCFKK